MVLGRHETALIIIDMQVKLFAKIHGREAILKNVATLIHLANIYHFPILVTEQYPKGLGKTLPPLIELLGEAYRPIEKTTFSCLGNEAFTSRLNILGERGVRDLIICGIETHICVYQTIRDLHRNNRWRIHPVADATGSRVEANWKWGLDLIRDMGAPVKPTETILYEILQESGTPEFKAMLPHIK